MLFEVIEADKQERINRKNKIEKFTLDYKVCIYKKNTTQKHCGICIYLCFTKQFVLPLFYPYK
jgi:hypothetical protein